MRKNTYYHHLKTRWGQRHQEIEKAVREKHKEAIKWLADVSKQSLIATLSGAVLLTAPIASSASFANSNTEHHAPPRLLTSQDLSLQLKSKLPQDTRPLTPEEEKEMAALLSTHFNMKVAPELNGKRLNRTYGIIGKEQHLYRFPGDSIEEHIEPGDNAGIVRDDGIAPGLGAWGYFARSRDSFTEKDKMRERYYIAVQTFLAPGFNEHVKEYGDFFRYRKMLVVNPDNGKAMVADIADAGPAEFTGKSLGGSPEVMQYLERVDGGGRGPVLYFFIDDPHDTIPLGPLSIHI